MEHLATSAKEEPSIWQAVFAVLIVVWVFGMVCRVFKDLFED